MTSWGKCKFATFFSSFISCLATVRFLECLSRMTNQTRERPVFSHISKLQGMHNLTCNKTYWRSNQTRHREFACLEFMQMQTIVCGNRNTISPSDVATKLQFVRNHIAACQHCKFIVFQEVICVKYDTVYEGEYHWNIDENGVLVLHPRQSEAEAATPFRIRPFWQKLFFCCFVLNIAVLCHFGAELWGRFLAYWCQGPQGQTKKSGSRSPDQESWTRTRWMMQSNWIRPTLLQEGRKAGSVSGDPAWTSSNTSSVMKVHHYHNIFQE